MNFKNCICSSDKADEKSQNEIGFSHLHLSALEQSSRMQLVHDMKNFHDSSSKNLTQDTKHNFNCELVKFTTRLMFHL